MIKVTGNNVSLRYQPSTSADRVGTANIGDCFYYVDTVNGWFQTVRLLDHQGLRQGDDRR